MSEFKFKSVLERACVLHQTERKALLQAGGAFSRHKLVESCESERGAEAGPSDARKWQRGAGGLPMQFESHLGMRRNGTVRFSSQMRNAQNR